MTKFLHTAKDGEHKMVSFTDLNALLQWAKQEGTIVIETDGDVLVIRTLK